MALANRKVRGKQSLCNWVFFTQCSLVTNIEPLVVGFEAFFLQRKKGRGESKMGKKKKKRGNTEKCLSYVAIVNY